LYAKYIIHLWHINLDYLEEPQKAQWQENKNYMMALVDYIMKIVEK
jgi:hypothetical protein